MISIIKYAEPITLKTAQDYARFSERVSFSKARYDYISNCDDGSIKLYYTNSYDRDYDYMLYSQPVVYPVI